jgi:hypothetical protein
VCNLVSIHGGKFSWVSKCRYLGAQFVSARTFECSFSEFKLKFFRAFNGIYGKIGRSASEETVLALLNAKCLPILLFQTEACPMLSRDKQSLEFAMTRLFMKIFRTGSASIVVECQRSFNFIPIKLQISSTAKFLQRFVTSENSLCLLFSEEASSKLNTILSYYGKNVLSASKLNCIIRELYCVS